MQVFFVFLLLMLLFDPSSIHGFGLSKFQEQVLTFSFSKCIRLISYTNKMSLMFCQQVLHPKALELGLKPLQLAFLWGWVFCNDVHDHYLINTEAKGHWHN